MSEFDQNGYELIPNVVDVDQVDVILDDLESLKGRPEAKERDGRMYGARNLLRLLPAVDRLARSSSFSRLADRLLGARSFPVRAIFFDKVPGANWDVGWHQDLTIAVQQRRDAPGFGKWTVKSGVVHVEPPPEILRGMVALRLHLDDCDAANGALRVIPGSHARGIMSADECDACVLASSAVTCDVLRGGVLAMRPLTLHASHSSDVPTHRRVIHVEYAAAHLPHGLEWAERARPL